MATSSRNVKATSKSSAASNDKSPKNRLGAINVVPLEQRSYLQNIAQLLHKNEFESDEDKQILLDNVHAEIRANVFEVSVDKKCSAIVERLLRQSSGRQLRGFLSQLIAGRKLYVTATNCNGSHVLQTLLSLVPPHVAAEQQQPADTDSADSSETPTLTELVLSCVQTLESAREGWAGLARSRYATHVLRSLVAALAGRCYVPDNAAGAGDGGGVLDTSASAPQQQQHHHQKQQQQQQQQQQFAVPAEFAQARGAIESALLLPAGGVGALSGTGSQAATSSTTTSSSTTATAVSSLARDPQASPVLQQLLVSSPGPQQTVRRLLGWPADDERVSAAAAAAAAEQKKGAKQRQQKQQQQQQQQPERDEDVADMLTHPVASHLVQRLLLSSGAAEYALLYRLYLRGRLASLATDRSGNWVVQSALAAPACDAPHAAMAADELLPQQQRDAALRRLLPQAGGVVLHLLRALARHQPSQAAPLAALLKALQRWASGSGGTARDAAQRLRRGLLTLQPATTEAATDTTFAVSSVGAQLAAAWCATPAPFAQPLWDALAAMPPSEAATLAADKAGAKLLEAWLQQQQHQQQAGGKRLLLDLLLAAPRSQLSQLARDKNGSRVLEAAYRDADVAGKARLAAALAPEAASLRTHVFGKFVWRACKLQQYTAGHAIDEWQAREASAAAKRAMFDELLLPTPPPPAAAAADELPAASTSRGGGGGGGKQVLERRRPVHQRQEEEEQQQQQQQQERPPRKAQKKKRSAVADEHETAAVRPEQHAQRPAKKKKRKRSDEAQPAAAVDEIDAMFDGVIDPPAAAKDKKKKKKQQEGPSSAANDASIDLLLQALSKSR